MPAMKEEAWQRRWLKHIFVDRGGGDQSGVVRWLSAEY
jgi:hypothetical protein